MARTNPQDEEGKIGYGQYWRQVKAIAKDAMIEARKSPKEDRRDAATRYAEETTDQHEWVIYTWANPYVLIHSAHEDCIFDDFGEQTFTNYSDAMAKMAGCALRADVMEALEDMLVAKNL